MLIYLWLLLTIPQDRPICSLWISQPPSQTALVQACGTAALGSYRLDVTYMGDVICTLPASSLLTVQQECTLAKPLNSYRINIVEPNYQTGICTVSTVTNTQPTPEEIRDQCPDAAKHTNGVIMRMTGTRPATPKAGPVCKPAPVPQPASIATSENYHLLAGKLIWHGYAKAECQNGALNTVTFAATPCGMDAARSEMLKWQNGMDPEIITAATAWNVPADLLKNIIARESQFWPWNGIHDEHGFIQITEDGADLVLRMSVPGYDRMKAARRHELRIAWLNQLDCVSCTPKQSYDHAKQSMSLYAEALAAYWCTYDGNWQVAVSAWNKKHQGITQ